MKKFYSLIGALALLGSFTANAVTVNFYTNSETYDEPYNLVNMINYGEADPTPQTLPGYVFNFEYDVESYLFFYPVSTDYELTMYCDDFDMSEYGNDYGYLSPTNGGFYLILEPNPELNEASFSITVYPQGEAPKELTHSVTFNFDGEGIDNPFEKVEVSYFDWTNFSDGKIEGIDSNFYIYECTAPISFDFTPKEGYNVDIEATYSEYIVVTPPQDGDGELIPGGRWNVYVYLPAPSDVFIDIFVSKIGEEPVPYNAILNIESSNDTPDAYKGLKYRTNSFGINKTPESSVVILEFGPESPLTLYLDAEEGYYIEEVNAISDTAVIWNAVTHPTDIPDDYTGYIYMNNTTWVLNVSPMAVNDNLEINVTVNSETSGIALPETSDKEDVIYNMQGVRVTNNNLPAGIYIINGKKTVIR